MIKIVSPEPDTFAVGIVPLKAVVEPARRSSEIARVMFYADGRLVCTLMDPARAECPWDAGPNITSHVIRAVAERIGGGRVVTSIRTKGLDLAEAVNVEVVQVTAVVSDRGRFIKGLPQNAFRVLRGQRPAEDHAFLGGRIAARDRDRRRRQRQHGAGDAAAEDVGEEVSRRARAERSGHADRVQRQPLHADAARDQCRSSV